jgi:hypothetical protein
MNKIFSELRERREEIEKSNGNILGQVTLADCVNNAPFNVWAEIGSPWYYCLENPMLFDKPLPARGMLGLWTYRAENNIW